MYFVVAALIGMAVLGEQVSIRRVAGLLLAGVGVILVAQ